MSFVDIVPAVREHPATRRERSLTRTGDELEGPAGWGCPGNGGHMRRRGCRSPDMRWDVADRQLAHVDSGGARGIGEDGREMT